MSIREQIWLFQEFDTGKYLEILKNEMGATEHPAEPRAYMVDGLPFYEPLEAEESVIIVSFNKVPLSGVLIDALANHPELVSDEMLVFWTIEQEILVETTMGEIRGKAVDIDPVKRDEFRELVQIPFLFL